jgi:CheY-like chemotaxis protein
MGLLHKTVLVIDDDPETREAIGELLSSAGIQPLKAADGIEALVLLSKHGPPNLILLDLTMPGMNGWEFMDELMEDDELSEIPVVVVSANKHARVPYAEALLLKPFEPNALLEMIEEHCNE